ncbi:hypothetical protein COEREDRAFT_94947 [Coemansia reversa NRRL 1564]|uniref:BZIP domain-containing protein n=1 Tax=Coemansia reversa (strain ATCC 12441 / NRRL 1564) TaxID=763665 RepID=A0A2G5B144_COERN|nr:hypothetical protein COEREDRAFT_94947 [Coemansia reversa NRRL 1564]|eukprot:PIA12732.1 hypothetical protein COEREDRAFT_94947 [Coemansia reversa NRRL 1564]
MASDPRHNPSPPNKDVKGSNTDTFAQATQQPTQGSSEGCSGESSDDNNDDLKSSANTAENAETSTSSRVWRQEISNLLTPQTVTEQAQVRRRKRNREAARRSRQRQKERERELVERQEQLTQRLKFLEKELVEWRMINSVSGEKEMRLVDPNDVRDSEDSALAENINRVYSLTMETLHIIGELQLQLDEITKELHSMIQMT